MDITPQLVEERLRAAGHRLTKTRKALVRVMITASQPLSIEDMRDHLKRLGVTVNKTTIYREVDFLLQQKLIEEVRLDPDRRYYEFALGTHHHHIRCLSCNTIVDVTLGAFETMSKQIQRQTKFTVVDHTIEFVGLCAVCQRRSH